MNGWEMFMTREWPENGMKTRKFKLHEKTISSIILNALEDAVPRVVFLVICERVTMMDNYKTILGFQTTFTTTPKMYGLVSLRQCSIQGDI